MAWEGIAARLEGRLVVVEPLTAEHEDDLWEAAQDPEVWRWLPWYAAAELPPLARGRARAL